MRGNVVLIKEDTGIVENIIVVGDTYIPPIGYEVQPSPNYPVFNGDIWDGEKFIDKHSEKLSLEELQPTQEEVSRAIVELQIINTLLELGVI